jgi:hypothetical protein
MIYGYTWVPCNSLFPLGVDTVCQELDILLGVNHFLAPTRKMLDSTLGMFAVLMMCSLLTRLSESDC